MMYSEFLDHSGLSEKNITYSEYTDFIEPVYMDAIEDKFRFCKTVRKAYSERVGAIVVMLGRNYDPTNEPEDLSAIQSRLKSAFLRDFGFQYSQFLK